MNIPNTLTAGDSMQWNDEAFTQSGTRYDSANYALSYELRGPKRLTVATTQSGSGWAAAVAPADTADLTPGPYWWSAIITAANIRLTVATGQLTVVADLSAIAVDGYDGRSVAAKSLADAEAALANLTSSGARTKKYEIGTRKAEYYTATELIDAIRYWRGILLNEQTAAGIANGLGNPRNLYVRFR
jgi:hypothetical protein